MTVKRLQLVVLSDDSFFAERSWTIDCDAEGENAVKEFFQSFNLEAMVHIRQIDKCFKHKPNCTDPHGLHRVPIDCPTEQEEAA